MNKKGPNLHDDLSRNEFAIMSVVWKKGRATAKEILDALFKGDVLSKKIAYTTLLTYLGRIEAKGYLSRSRLEGEKAYVYKPTVPRSSVSIGVIDKLITHLGVKPSAFLSRFIDAKGDLELIVRLFLGPNMRYTTIYCMIAIDIHKTDRKIFSHPAVR